MIATLVAVLMTAVAAAAALFAVTDRHGTAAPAAPPPASPTPEPEHTVTPEEAKAKTCNALKESYPAVSHAIDEREKYNTRPWSDPELLRSVNQLVDAMQTLSAKLEDSLQVSTPPELRSAVLDYIAGLRAVSISERNHASNVQLNGTGLFYNQVVDAPLRICGIQG
ncbi:hypothetical protein E2F47_24990 [Mycobacterium eburneum]|nr:hypothetical protein [Mycobacterium eburneum]TDH48123.1 hypothetical protein E2F47_24990 [Mycobacterium eburneum]